jgi:2-haloacid dehalogenase
MPRPQPPKAVVFDIGRVLVEWDPARLYARRIPDAAERAALWSRVDFDGMNLAGDRDGSLAEAVEALAARHPADAAHIRAWRAQWREMIGSEMVGTVALLRALRGRGVPVHALSNFAADTYAEARELFPVLREFDLEVISGREGAVKPDPAIYGILEARAGLSGPDLFFTDDRADNIAAARARGWRAHLFEGADGLAAALRAEGLGV